MLDVLTNQRPTLLYIRPTTFTQNLRSKVSFQIPKHLPPECVVNIKEQEIKTKFLDQNFLQAKVDTHMKNQKSNITVYQKHLKLVHLT
jgi:hypothetical protein